MNSAKIDGASPQLVRGIGLRSAISLNVINMVGVGPFITLPLIVLAMRGPQAYWAWILAAVLAGCDGLVWAELGAAMPEAGGSYWYLREIYGPGKAGRLISFLYIWQLTFSAPLSIASGCVGLAQYAGYLFPALRRVYFARELPIPAPVAGGFHIAFMVGPSTLLAIGCCLFTTALLYRNIQSIARFANWLWIGVMGTLLTVVVCGLLHFQPKLAFHSAPGAFRTSGEFFAGLGAAMLIATYDYWGAYSINFLGGEVRDPGRTIPRAILWSVALVAALYLLFNTSVTGVIPWKEFGTTASAKFSVAALVMERIYGSLAGRIAAVLVIWTAFASVYSLLLAYSRVPYAAALDGNYFRAFAHLHPRHRFPDVSLFVLAGVSLIFCFFQLIDLVAALVVIRILLQFLLQHLGVMILRHTHPEMKRPFRIWLYPLPPLAAMAGFVYMLFARPNFGREFVFAGAIVVTGCILYFIRARARREWPFAKTGLSL